MMKTGSKHYTMYICTTGSSSIHHRWSVYQQVGMCTVKRLTKFLSQKWRSQKLEYTEWTESWQRTNDLNKVV